MSYFGGSSGMVGDPGFFGTLFGRVRRAAVGFAGGGPVGAAAGFIRPTSRPISQVPGIKGAIQRLVPGGKTGLQVASDDAAMRPRRKRMNVTNDKALRRAIRRTSGFVKLAKRALKNTDFVIVSKSSLAVARAKKRTVADIHHAE